MAPLMVRQPPVVVVFFVDGNPIGRLFGLELGFKETTGNFTISLVANLTDYTGLYRSFR